jgi:hypothetical protein
MMIHVVVMKCLMIPCTILVGLPLLIHIELLWRSVSQRFKNWGVGVRGFAYQLHCPGGSYSFWLSATLFIWALKWIDMKVKAKFFAAEHRNRYLMCTNGASYRAVDSCCQHQRAKSWCPVSNHTKSCKWDRIVTRITYRVGVTKIVPWRSCGWLTPALLPDLPLRRSFPFSLLIELSVLYFHMAAVHS